MRRSILYHQNTIKAPQGTILPQSGEARRHEVPYNTWCGGSVLGCRSAVAAVPGKTNCQLLHERVANLHTKVPICARGKHLGGIWEVGGIWRPSESGGPFSIIKMQAKRRGRPFYRRVAKVRGTKYRKTHGSREGARPELTRERHSPTVTHAARNPTGQACLGNLQRYSFAAQAKPGGRESSFGLLLLLHQNQNLSMVF